MRCIQLAPLLFVTIGYLLAGCAQQRIELASGRAGVTQPIYLHTAHQPVASAIFFPGGSGAVAAVRANFLLRVADDFAAAGITVAVADAPSDNALGMAKPFRASAAQATDTAAIAAFLRNRAAVPVWLVGTSNGTISAANAAVRLGPPQIAGVVLTSSVWTGGLAAVPLDELRVPTLLVHNQNDGCPASPFANAAPALGGLTAAPAKQLIAVRSTTETSGPCDALSPHGYLGIESSVVSQIVAWIRSH